MTADPYVGKVLLVDLPGTKRRRYRWFVKKREDKRYIVRAPKVGVKISNLTRKRNTDFGKETLLPLGAKPHSHLTRTTRKHT
jgi:hypothetical protein